MSRFTTTHSERGREEDKFEIAWTRTLYLHTIQCILIQEKEESGCVPFYKQSDESVIKKGILRVHKNGYMFF